MSLRRLALATTALSSLLLLNGVVTAPAHAQQGPTVMPGGKLDVTVQGFARFLAGIGDLKEKTGNPNGGSYDFRNDTEVHILARGKDEATGIEYGATIEFEADTNRTGNTDETWIFVKGGFGELRFGDNDGIGKDMAIGGFTVAVGTGGTDGEILESPRLNFLTASDSDATKVIYYSPSIAGFQLGVSYTPSTGSSGDNLRSTNDGSVDDYVDGGISFKGGVGGFDVLASVLGAFGHVNTNVDDDEVQGLYAGLKVGLFGFTLAGGMGTEEFAGLDRKWFNVGAAATLGPVAVSVNYGDCFDCDGAEPSNLIVGAELGLMPGVSLSGEVSFFDEDRGADDDGVLGVVRLGVSF